jgi:hypothetical protein
MGKHRCLLREKERERERERERDKVGGGSERHYNSGEGQENNIFSFEGSQGVPASPSGRIEACVQDYEVGGAALERNLV